MTAPPVWDQALDRLRPRVSAQNYDMWLAPIEYVSWEAGRLRLRAPNSYVRIWIESNFLDAIRAEMQTVTGQDVAIGQTGRRAGTVLATGVARIFGGDFVVLGASGQGEGGEQGDG